VLRPLPACHWHQPQPLAMAPLLPLLHLANTLLSLQVLLLTPRISTEGLTDM
jgi:hypothetical protein